MQIGTDIIQIRRIEEAIDRHGERFCKRFLGSREIQTLRKRPESLAGYWAAKEAISKALGCGIGRELSFHDIVLFMDHRGAPHFALSQRAQTRFAIRSRSLSISHDGGFAIAVAVVVLARDDQPPPTK
jgi:holo-[acyl-carrier protein] synthase